MYGGEGEIRTPDSLTTMPDFESGAFNRALPPLRIVKLLILVVLQNRSVLQVPAIRAGVRSGVPSVSAAHQALHSGSLVLGSEMGVAHHHLERPVPEQLCDSAQIHPGHHESTGKSMAVAMPGVPLDPGLFARSTDSSVAVLVGITRTSICFSLARTQSPDRVFYEINVARLSLFFANARSGFGLRPQDRERGAKPSKRRWSAEQNHPGAGL